MKKRRLAKQENPTEKKGIIGAFCRTYSITQAMEQFIPGMYEQTDIPNRYTYTGGTTTGGAILYDGDLFLYSHHATDPCSGQLVNAFDLIRLHMYGDLDKEAKEGTPSVKLPSFQAMAKMARADKEVSTLLIKEKFERAKKVIWSGKSGTGRGRECRLGTESYKRWKWENRKNDCKCNTGTGK